MDASLQIRGGGAILIYMTGTLVTMFGAYLPMLALESPVANARTLIFLIVIPIALGFMTCTIQEHRRLLAILLVPMLLYGFYYVYAFGNVLKHQTEQDRMFAQQLSYDLQRMDYEGSHPGRQEALDELTMIGGEPPSLELLIAAKRQPLMANIIQPRLRENDWLGYVLLRHCFPYDFIPLVQVDAEDRSYADSHDPVISNAVYAIYLRDKRIIVKFQ